ncbi:hypothetical protein EZS27_036786 [termite gut metagenome]|uniref:Uncharacterized protein n=1 Tax=termite gut metagenome TaxID=433724 RepID=A0A5J4PTZ7_9ZZZZ
MHYGLTSTDGVHWIEVYDTSYNTVCWSKELAIFVALGAPASSTGIAISSDGINWTPYTSSFASNYNLSHVSWFPTINKFIATYGISSTIGGFLTSSDGITWTNIAMLSALPVNVAYSETLGIFLSTGTTTSVKLILK